MVPTPDPIPEVFESAQLVALEGVARVTGPLARWENQAVLTEVRDLVSDQNGFVADFYRQLAGEEEGNLFYSPYSLYTALAVAYAGASGNTAAQFHEVMNIGAPADRFHANLNSLDLTLLNDSVMPGAAEDGENGSRPILSVANGLWIQDGLEVRPRFIDTVTSNYDIGLQQLDFKKYPDGAVEAINRWVEEATQGKIEQVVSPESITDDTVLIITNAVYFKGDWADKFSEENTTDQPFYLLDDRVALVPLMHQSNNYGYHIGDEYQAVSLPYSGDAFELLVVMPNEGTFEAFEESLTGEGLDKIARSMGGGTVTLRLPRFKLEYSFSARDGLENLGLTNAFDREQANFQPIASHLSGLTIEELWFEDAVQKAFVEVNEEGSEAAAATAMVMDGIATSAPPQPVEITIDRPFIFLLRHPNTGAILFMGRVLNPDPDAPTVARSEIQPTPTPGPPPPPPMVFRGAAILNGVAAPLGTEILAFDGNREVGRAMAGDYGEFTLIVGRSEGPITFKVGGIDAMERIPKWLSGDITPGFKLSASSE